MKRVAAMAALLALVAGCASSPPPIPHVPDVDLAKFMGDWYVIAHIPSRSEREAYDAVESYRLDTDGRIRTTYRQRVGSFTAPVETMTPVATVAPGSGNAVWAMQFVWPIQAEYVIVDLAPDYSRTIVGRSKRDYVWLMARTPQLPPEELQAAIVRIRALGYDTSKLRLVPQSERTP